MSTYGAALGDQRNWCDYARREPTLLLYLSGTCADTAGALCPATASLLWQKVAKLDQAWRKAKEVIKGLEFILYNEAGQELRPLA